MEVVAGATIWGMFSAWLLFTHFGLPPMIVRAAGSVVWLELLAVGAWSFGSETCVQRPCGPIAEAGRSAAEFDVPGLAVAILALSLAYARRMAASHRA